jgi:DNA-directed RNA polymerase specialized sigma24 family protein
MDNEDLARLLGRLHPDPVFAAQEYEHLRQKLVTHFRNNNKPFSSEAEELADRALDIIAQKPESHEIKNVTEYAFGVARFLLRKSLRQRQGPKVEDIQRFCVRNENPERTILEEMEAKRRLKCFLQCMKGFRPEERWLVLEYYPNESRDLEQHRLRVAESLGIDPYALRMRMNRLRTKLEKCCAGCFAGGKENRQ